MTDIMCCDEMPLQLQWLRQPASLLRLLQRPVWLDAWRYGEEGRASLLWRGLPNHLLLLYILKLADRCDRVCCVLCVQRVSRQLRVLKHMHMKRDRLAVAHARRAGPIGSH